MYTLARRLLHKFKSASKAPLIGREDGLCLDEIGRERGVDEEDLDESSGCELTRRFHCPACSTGYSHQT